jgi:glutaredoxin
MTKLATRALRSIPVAIALTLSLQGCAPSAPPEAPSASDAQTAPVAMYMTEWCPVCRQARKWLDERGYEFIEHDVERDPRAAVFFVAVNPHGSVPTFDVGGEILIGFDPKRLNEAITAFGGDQAQSSVQPSAISHQQNEMGYLRRSTRSPEM